MFLFLIIAHLSLADSLFAHGMYDEARIEYLREFYFHPEQYYNESKRISFALSLVYIDTLNGVHELKKITRDIPEMSYDATRRVAQHFIALGYTEYARGILYITDSTRIYGYTFLKDRNVIAARDYFFTLGDTALVNDIDHYMDLPKKSLRTATVLSLICPGAGEIYGGNVGLGIKDFVLNAGSVFLLYNALRQKKYIDAVLVFNFLFHRFYVGSLYNAQKTILDSNSTQFDDWMEYMHTTYFLDMYKEN